MVKVVQTDCESSFISSKNQIWYFPFGIFIDITHYMLIYRHILKWHENYLCSSLPWLPRALLPLRTLIILIICRCHLLKELRHDWWDVSPAGKRVTNDPSEGHRCAQVRLGVSRVKQKTNIREERNQTDTESTDRTHDRGDRNQPFTVETALKFGFCCFSIRLLS